MLGSVQPPPHSTRQHTALGMWVGGLGAAEISSLASEPAGAGYCNEMCERLMLTCEMCGVRCFRICPKHALAPDDSGMHQTLYIFCHGERHRYSTFLIGSFVWCPLLLQWYAHTGGWGGMPFCSLPSNRVKCYASTAGGGGHLEDRLLDQAQVRASYTPAFWGSFA